MKSYIFSNLISGYFVFKYLYGKCAFLDLYKTLV